MSIQMSELEPLSELTQAQQIDPLLRRSAEALGMPDGVFDGINTPDLSRLKEAVGLKEAGAFFGVAVGAAALVLGGGGRVAADDICGSGFEHTGDYFDGAPICDIIPNNPPATNPQPAPTAPPATNPAPRPTPPTQPTSPPAPTRTTNTLACGSLDGDGDGIPNRDDPAPNFRDSDLDGFPNDTENKFNDVNDTSPGLGEVGIDQMRLSGVDVDTGSDSANLNRMIAASVHPNDWVQTATNFASLGVAVLDTTTTSTTATTEATTTTITIPATTTERPNAATEAAAAPTTEVEPAAAESESTAAEQDELVVVIDPKTGRFDWLSNPAIIGAGIVIILAGGAILVARRRKRDEDDALIPSAAGTTKNRQEGSGFSGAAGG